MKKKSKFKNLLYRDIKEFNVILLVIMGVLIVSMSGFVSYALVSFNTTSENLITLVAGNIPKVYKYTGSYQIYNVPKTGYYKIEAYGAQGGSYDDNIGGLGGKTSGTIYLTEGEKLYIYVGGQGESLTSGDKFTSKGGYNGGAPGGDENGIYSFGGGGATDIRYFIDEPETEELVWNSKSGIDARIMVAAGGGGSVYMEDVIAGGGGGLFGTLGTANGIYGTSDYYAGGATNIDGGINEFNIEKNGLYGFANQIVTANFGGGGGGGYFGGATGEYTGGGGGSSYISGYAGNSLHESEKYFINAESSSGVNEGNGKVSISYINNNIEKNTYNNVRFVKDCISGSTINKDNIWSEVQVMVNGKNVALSKKATIDGKEVENINYLTDNNLNNYITYNSDEKYNCLILDLEQEYNVDEIAIWHYFKDERNFSNDLIYTSSDNENWTLIKNNTAPETSEGIRIVK